METDFQKIEKMFLQINDKLQAMDDKLGYLVIENEQRKEENEKMREKIINQEFKIAALERETKRKNIIIRGVEDKENESRDETTKVSAQIVQKLGVTINKEVDIDEAKRIGKYKADGQRPIVLKLTTGTKKAEILRNSKGLKGSKIWLDEDYTKEVQEERKILIPQLKEAREKGNKAQLKYNKLIINNVIYESKDFKNMEKNENEQDPNEKKRTISERSPQSTTETGQVAKISKNY